MVPNRRATMVVKKNLTAVYGGFLQYDKCCFHRHAMHCTGNDCEYWVGKYRSLEPAGGMLRSFIKLLFLLKLQNTHALM